MRNTRPEQKPSVEVIMCHNEKDFFSIQKRLFDLKYPEISITGIEVIRQGDITRVCETVRGKLHSGKFVVLVNDGKVQHDLGENIINTLLTSSILPQRQMMLLSWLSPKEFEALEPSEIYRINTIMNHSDAIYARIQELLSTQEDQAELRKIA